MSCLRSIAFLGKYLKLAASARALEKLNFPEYRFSVRAAAGQSKQIFDSLRRKYVALTPEEWVRQHAVRFFVEELKYPASLIGVETGLRVNRLLRRTDLLVHTREGKPWMIVECKAPGVAVNHDTLYQAARYNLALRVQYLVLTNGLQHVCCRLDAGGPVFLDGWPGYEG
jgi:hypothetical protein